MCNKTCREAVCHKLTGENHKMIERLYKNLGEARLEFVGDAEKNIQYGAGMAWKDLEADEVDVRKHIDSEDQSGKPASWEQWGGIVERGDPKTLMLVRLCPKMSSARSPGPGPIRKAEWTKFANKHLKNRKVVLHTDGARSYRISVPGVLHDHVVHQKKRVTVNGESVWLKPKFVKVVTHKLPNGGGNLKVKAGTQIIDRFWSHLRSHLKSNSNTVGSHGLRRAVRSAQWTYWFKGQNLWEETGKMMVTLSKR